MKVNQTFFRLIRAFFYLIHTFSNKWKKVAKKTCSDKFL
jgi:hypothetical protein